MTPRIRLIQADYACRIALDLHIQYLICLYYIYATLEAGLEQHADNPVLIPTSNPAILARAQSVEQDIQYFCRLAKQASPSASEDLTRRLSPRTRVALQQYTDRLELLTGRKASSVASSSKIHYSYAPSQPTPELLLAHSYGMFCSSASDIAAETEVSPLYGRPFRRPSDSQNSRAVLSARRQRWAALL